MGARASFASNVEVNNELSLDAAYDDNVTKSYTDHISDELARLAYSLMVQPNVPENVSLNVGYGLGIKKYLSQFEYDTIIHQGLFNFQYTGEHMYAGLDAQARYRGIRNGLRNYRWLQAGSFVGFLFENYTSIRADAELASLDFEGSDYFDYWAQAYELKLEYKPRPILFEITANIEERDYKRPAYDAEFSGDETFLILTNNPRHDVKTAFGTKFGWRDGFVINVLYQAVINSSNSYGRTFFEHDFGFEGSTALPWKINLHTLALFKLRTHIQKTLLPQSSVLEEEEEGLSEMDISLTRPITDWLQAEIGYQRYWQAYEYHKLEFYKNLFSAGFAVKF